MSQLNQQDKESDKNEFTLFNPRESDPLGVFGGPAPPFNSISKQIFTNTPMEKMETEDDPEEGQESYELPSKEFVNNQSQTPINSQGYGSLEQKFNKPIEEQKFNKPIEEQKFNKPIEEQKYNKPIEEQKFNKPIEEQKLYTPVGGQKFNQPIEGQKFNQPIEGQNFNQPIEGQKLNQPIEGQKFDQPIERQRFNQPIEEQKLNQPIEGSQFVKPVIQESFPQQQQHQQPPQTNYQQNIQQNFPKNFEEEGYSYCQQTYQPQWQMGNANNQNNEFSSYTSGTFSLNEGVTDCFYQGMSQPSFQSQYQPKLNMYQNGQSYPFQNQNNYYQQPQGYSQANQVPFRQQNTYINVCANCSGTGINHQGFPCNCSNRTPETDTEYKNINRSLTYTPRGYLNH